MKKNYDILSYLTVLMSLVLVPTLGIAQSDNYPTKAVRIIVPFAPGGSVDLVSRMLAPKLSEFLGQPVIADNRSGASGNIGTELVARGPADGYTVLMNTLPFVVNPHIYGKAPYHPINDFAPVGMVGISPSIVTVHPSVPVYSIKELIAFARARPKLINYASAGVGTNPHIGGELFNFMAKTSLIAVHYKGGGPGLVAAMSGEVSATFTNIAETSSYVRAKRLRPLGVTSLKRSPAFPDIPTVDQSGLPGYEFVTWFGIFAPAKTPRNAVNVLNEQMRKALATPEIVRMFNERGIEIAVSSPEEFAAHLKKENERWAAVVRERGMRAE